MPHQSENVQQKIVKLHYGEADRPKPLPVYIFNFELDHFAFESGTFDLVLCMEVIEHLVYSPSHMLAEAHRVLKPGGILLLTTPNGLNLYKTILMLRNIPIAFKYSGYGVYGRHNREFTNQELIKLLEASGFEIRTAFEENVYADLEPERKSERYLYRSIYKLSNLPIS